MAIYISNALYLAANLAGDNPNRALIGWHSIYARAEVISGAAADGFPASNVWSGDTYSKWRSLTGASGTLLAVSNSSAESVNYIGIAGHNFFTAGIQYRLIAVTGGVYSYLSSFKTVSDNSPIIEYFDSTYADLFFFEFNVPALQYVEIAHVKVGRVFRLQRQRYVGDVPSGMGKTVEKIGSKSFSGQHLGSVLISQGDKFSITQENNTPDFIRSTDFKNFIAHAHLLQKKSAGCVETFFYAWRPEDYPLEVQYCGETTSFNPPTNQRSNGMMQWSMSGDAFE